MTRSSFVRFAWVVSAAFALLLLAGCGDGGPVNAKVTKENLDKVQLGSKLTDIEALLGPGEASPPASNAKPGDEKLVWKRWKHSARGAELIVGLGDTNEVEVLDKKTQK